MKTRTTRRQIPRHPDLRSELERDCRRVLRAAYQPIQQARQRHDGAWLVEAVDHYREVCTMWEVSS